MPDVLIEGVMAEGGERPRAGDGAATHGRVLSPQARRLLERCLVEVRGEAAGSEASATAASPPASPEEARTEGE